MIKYPIFCVKNKMIICSICLKDCHVNFSKIKINTIEDNNYRNCQCNLNNHSEFNEFTFGIINKLKNNIFFIIVCLILINVFFGVLYDTFGELRGINQERENDKKKYLFYLSNE